MEIGGLSGLVGQTTARVAAVFEEVDEGDIVIDDELFKLASKRKLIETRHNRSKARNFSAPGTGQFF